jgi:hypothetical protein
MNFPQTITISVTADDIAQGKQRDCRRCPIACAVRRAFPHAVVDVDEADINIWKSGLIAETFREYVLPDEAREFISAFDAGESVKPFTFEAVAA